MAAFDRELVNLVNEPKIRIDGLFSLLSHIIIRLNYEITNGRYF